MTKSLLIIDSQTNAYKDTYSGIFNNSAYTIQEVKSIPAAIEWSNDNHPHVVIYVIRGASYVDTKGFKFLKSLLDQTSFMVLSASLAYNQVKEIFESGTEAFLPLNPPVNEMALAIQSLDKGNRYISPQITSKLFSQSLKNNTAEIESQLLINKIQYPLPNKKYVLRSKLLNLLENRPTKRFTLLSAPAGYGKTVSINQWLDHSTKPKVYLSIDNEIDNLKSFLQYIYFGISRELNQKLPHYQDILSSNPLPENDKTIDLVLNDLNTLPEPFILVLDDYHNVCNPTINQLINKIIHYPIKHLHLVIISRYDPSLDINLVRNQGILTEIGVEDLAFDKTETVQLFENFKHTNCDVKQINKVLEKTEGWVLGIRLTIMAIGHKKERDKGNNLTCNYYEAGNYLFNEVLSKQPKKYQQALIVTSALDRFNADILNKLFSDSSYQVSVTGKEFINWLNKSNVFVISLDSQFEWFRFHHVFGDLLKNTANKSLSKKVLKKVNLDAYAWFHKNGYVEEAINCALTLKEYDLAINALSDFRWQLINRNKWEYLENILNVIPENKLNKQLNLILTQAWIMKHKFRLREMKSLIESSKHLLTKNAANKKLEPEWSFFNAFYTIFYDGDIELGLACVDKTKALFKGKGNKILVAETTILYTLAKQMEGNGKGILKEIDEQVEKCLKADGKAWEAYTLSKCLINLLEGQLPFTFCEAKLLNQYAINKPNSYLEQWSHWFLGISALNLFQIDKAVNYFERLLDYPPELNDRLIFDAYIGLALGYSFLNKPQQVEETLAEVSKFVENCNSKFFIDLYRAAEARIALLQGNIPLLREWYFSFSTDISIPVVFFFIDNPLITKCRALIQMETPESLDLALNKLKEYKQSTSKYNNSYQQIEIGVLETICLHKQNQKEDALNALNKLLHVTMRTGWVRPYAEAPEPMMELLHNFKTHDLLGTYINHLTSTIKQYTIVKPHKRPVEKTNKAINSEANQMLSIREHQVLKLATQGKRNKEIAMDLFISENTVKKHLTNIFTKMKVDNRIELINRAKKLNIL